MHPVRQPPNIPLGDPETTPPPGSSGNHVANRLDGIDLVVGVRPVIDPGGINVGPIVRGLDTETGSLDPTVNKRDGVGRPLLPPIGSGRVGHNIEGNQNNVSRGAYDGRSLPSSMKSTPPGDRGLAPPPGFGPIGTNPRAVRAPVEPLPVAARPGGTPARGM